MNVADGERMAISTQSCHHKEQEEIGGSIQSRCPLEALKDSRVGELFHLAVEPSYIRAISNQI